MFPLLALAPPAIAQNSAIDSQSFRRPTSWSAETTLACGGLPTVIWQFRGAGGAPEQRQIMVAAAPGRAVLYRICTVVARDGATVGLTVDGARQEALAEDRCLDVLAERHIVLEERDNPAGEINGFYCMLPLD